MIDLSVEADHSETNPPSRSSENLGCPNLTNEELFAGRRKAPPLSGRELERRSLDENASDALRANGPLASVVVGSTETICGLIDTRYEVLPSPRPAFDPRTFTKPNLASKPVPEPPPFVPEPVKAKLDYENVDVSASIEPKINPLALDRFAKCVPYENINLEYISRLVEEGYSKEMVVRALGITRNDVEMACDILHEFGTKTAPC